jgi:hypothetical protein
MMLTRNPLNIREAVSMSIRFGASLPDRILLDPDPPETAGGNVGSGGSQPAAAPAAEPSPVSPGPGLGDDGGSLEASFLPETNSIAAPPQTAVDQWQSIRDAAGSMGYDLSRFQDDRQALLHLVQEAGRAREANYYAQFGQALAPRAQEIQQYLNQQQGSAASPERNEWEPPEFDERWMGLVDRDPATGLYVGKPGTPPQIVERVNQFAEWSNRFSRNPFQAIQQYHQAVVPKLVTEAVTKQLAGYQRQQAVDQILAANSQWLYQHDADGRVATDYRGQPMPSPSGTRYIQHVRTLSEAGITDPRTQDQIARQLMMGEIAMGKQQTPAAPATTAAAAARPNVNPLQAQPHQARAAHPAATEPVEEGRSLSEILREEFARAGITDADFLPGE